MPTISSRISKKEMDVITHYANCCGETVSNLIRKIMIKEATFMDGFGGPREYECNIMTPDNATGEEENKTVQEAFNYARRVMGFSEIDEI